MSITNVIDIYLTYLVCYYGFGGVHMTIGEKIYALRKELGLSQKDFAEKVGTSQSAINYWENGKRQPRLEQIQKIVSALNIPLHEFLDISQLGDFAYAALENNNIELAELLYKLTDLKFNEKYSKREQIEIYCSLLTDEGQAKLLDYAKLLYDSDDYRLDIDTDDKHF